MSDDPTARAAEEMCRQIPVLPWREALPFPCQHCLDAAQALDAAGLLVTKEHDAQVAARALREAADALESATEGEGREGIRTWRQPAQDAYSIAVEESQSALRERADRIEAGESDA